MKYQTKTFLRARLHEMGILPDTKHGQNFLIDNNLQRLIVDSAELGPTDVVLEVGVGTASLTALVAPQVAAVIGVEIDPHLYEIASEQLFDYPNVELLKQDALANKNNIHPRVLAAVQQQLTSDPAFRLKLVANLPYNIATPILSNLLTCEPVPDLMVATIQKELADRLVADPNCKDYGALSVWVQAQSDVEIVRIMPPSAFWPAPKVQSAIVKIRVDRDRRAAIGHLKYFHQMTKALFLHRRKFLRANVVAAMKHHLNKTQVDQVLAEMGFVADARTEQLDVPTLLKFSQLLQEAAPAWTL